MEYILILFGVCSLLYFIYYLIKNTDRQSNLNRSKEIIEIIDDLSSSRHGSPVLVSYFDELFMYVRSNDLTVFELEIAGIGYIYDQVCMGIEKYIQTLQKQKSTSPVTTDDIQKQISELTQSYDIFKTKYEKFVLNGWQIDNE